MKSVAIALILVTTLLAIGCLAAASHASARGSSAATDSLYNARHPRLLFFHNEVPALQSKVGDGGYDDDAFNFIRNMAENFYPSLIPHAMMGNDFGMTAAPLLGVATYLTVPEDNVADSLGQVLTLYLTDTYDVDFDEASSALRLHALSFGYDMFFRNANDSIRGVVRDEMVAYLETMARSFPYQLWKYRPYLANHSAMVAGGVGLAAVCLDGEADSLLISDAFNYADAIVDSLLLFQVDPDGSYKEGALYAGWTMRNLIYYFHARKRHDGYNYADNPRVRKLEQWLAYELLPEGDARINNLNDCTYFNVPLSYYMTYFDWAQSEWNSNLSAWIWERVAGPYGVDKGISADKVGTALWNQNLTPQQPDSVLPGSFLWEDRGLYHYRTGWQSGTSSNDVMFTFFSGQFHGGHAQEDQNQFTLYGYGERFVIDHGPGAAAKQSEAHNIVFIDGQGQHNAGSSIGTDGRISAFLMNAFADYVQGDATRAYTTHSPFNNPDYPFPGFDWSWGYSGSNPVEFARRDVIAVHDGTMPPYFIVRDDVDKDGMEHDYQWRMHTLAGNTVDTTSDPIRITAGSSYLTIYSAGPDLAALTKSVQPFDNQTEEPDATLLTLTTPAVNPGFAFVLIPGDGNFTEPVVTQERLHWGSVSLIDWQNGVTDCLVFNPAGQTVTVEPGNTGTGQSHRDYFDLPTPSASGRFLTTDASLAVLRFNSGAVESYLASGVSQLRYDKTTYIYIEGGTANCARSGARIDIDADDRGFTFYGPDVTELMYRDQPIPFTKINGYLMSLPAAELSDAAPSQADVTVRLHPNPSNPSTRLSLELSRNAPVRVVVYDVRGRVVARLWDGPLTRGTHAIEWNGKGRDGASVASGTYFVKIVANDVSRTLKLTVLK